MDLKDKINTEKKIEKLNKSKNIFINIKSDYFIQKLFAYMQSGITLKIIKCNNNIKKRLNININDYKYFSEKYSSIKLEIISIQNEYGPFIKIKKTKLNKEDNVSKINIIIDYQIKSFKDLFFYCKCIESIKFTKFYRNDITDMSWMF